MRAFTKVSATQVTKFVACNRQWFFEYPMGIKPEQKGSAALGESIHKEAENYLKVGTHPSMPVVQAALKFLPEPGTVFVEEPIELDIRGVSLIGKVDLIDFHTDPDIPTVVDHKSMKNLQWLLDAEALRKNIQMNVYGMAVLGMIAKWETAAPDALRYKHIGYQTQGTPAVEMSEVVVPVPHVLEKWEGIGEIVDRMKKVAVLEAPDLVTPTWSACSAFGGCPHRQRCAAIASNQRLSQGAAPMGANANPAADIINRIRAREQARLAAEAAAPEVKPPTPEQTPEVKPAVVEKTPDEKARAARLAAARAALGKAGVKDAVVEPPVQTEVGGRFDPPDAPTTGKMEEAVLRESFIKDVVKLLGRDESAIPALVEQVEFMRIIEEGVTGKTLDSGTTAAKVRVWEKSLESANKAARVEAEPAGRRPKNFAEKLAALHWSPEQVAKMPAGTMKAIIEGSASAKEYSPLPDGTVKKVAKAAEVVESKQEVEEEARVNRDEGSDEPVWYYHPESDEFVNLKPSEVSETMSVELVLIGDNKAKLQAESDLQAMKEEKTVASPFLDAVLAAVGSRRKSGPPKHKQTIELDVPKSAEARVAPIVEVKPPAADGLILYIDCRPESGVQVLDLSVVLEPYMLAVAAAGQDGSGRKPLGHYSMVDYSQGPGRVVGLMVSEGLPSGHLFVDTRLPCSNAALEVLRPMANVIIRATR